MKHIGFDQSTVLNEFARIAHEKGFIKVAEEGKPETKGPGPQPKEEQKMLEPEVKTKKPDLAKEFDKVLVRYPGIKKYYAGGPATKRLITELESGAMKDILRRIGGVLSPLVSEYSKLREVIVEGLRGAKVPEQRIKQIAPEATRRVTEEQELPKVSSKKDAAIHEDKKYDVFDETGEDLVDIAHPGGGTKTELSHSKTDENLVETIVEQQERDKEVAMSVPKGTYAALVKLYNQLNKMGYKDHLDGLAKTIKAIATPEDILSHTLYSLANKLDSLGFVEAADKVDNLLKKVN